MPAPATPKPVTVDFESIGIEKRPHYPPSPVGVSIKHYGKAPRYYGWGHINGGNNSTWGEARAALKAVWDSDSPILFHNAKFDLALAEVHMKLPMLPWERIHDTLFLLFLDDPRESTFSLKPSSERLLGMKPDERDAVEDWLVEHQPLRQNGIKITRGRGKNGAGKYIAYAPGDIVGPYANSDVDRTEKLFVHLYRSVIERGMRNAYDRERQTLIVLNEMEKYGIQTDYERLDRDVERYNSAREQVRTWICKRLKVSTDSSVFNLGSDAQLLEALIARGEVDETRLMLTATGNPSASKESLSGAMNDRVLCEMLAYMSELNTCLDTFMQNYLYTASLTPARTIFTDWNQVRQDRHSGKGIVGTTTGRLSSTPNFQNLSNEFDPHFNHLVDKSKYPDPKDYKSALTKTVKCPFMLPPLPLVRSYIIPFEGDVLIDRDYSQQELRILGHYEGKALYEAYCANMWMDVHDWARSSINDLLNASYTRRPIKDIGFGLIYGMGLGKLATKADTDVATAKTLKNAYLTVAPGLKDLYKDMRQRAKDNEPLYTWGGREYYCEEPKLLNGQVRTFDYKMVNILVQGSAADCTKQAFINYHNMKPKNHRLILNVHDQLTSSIPERDLKEGMEIMREAMESVKFSIPMLTEGSWSPNDWDKSSLIDYDKKGVILYAD